MNENADASCLTKVALVEGREPLYVSVRCELFQRDQSCKKAQCPLFDKNKQYVDAHHKYKAVRREFIKGIFIRTK